MSADRKACTGPFGWKALTGKRSSGKGSEMRGRERKFSEVTVQ
jgi:hypothetical protein